MDGITRRGFLKSVAALVAAPAIVRADWIMPVQAPPFRAREIMEYDIRWDAMVFRADIVADGVQKYVTWMLDVPMRNAELLALRKQALKRLFADARGSRRVIAPEMPRGVQSFDDYMAKVRYLEGRHRLQI